MAAVRAERQRRGARPVGYDDCRFEQTSCEIAADIAHAQCINQGKPAEFCEGEQQNAYADCWAEYLSCRSQVLNSCSFERNICLSMCNAIYGC